MCIFPFYVSSNAQYSYFSSLFNQAGQNAPQAFGQQGLYNNMSITVSMAGASGAVRPIPSMGCPVAMSNNSICNVGSICNDQVKQI